ncbi:RGA Target 1 [Hibiscus trionum]|uniref:RGA Target 1 n=1 Tax=Hibiscus trionum TaxID=183268 RepID=A0A9W7M5H5_HIBTR|nr:RGA Target 1 [Hibiscus trionum]
MGSLMAGWDSHVSESDPKSVLRERNRSLTKEEVEAFWKSQKQTEEEHVEDTLSNPKQGFLDMDAETNLENITKKNGWWRRSNWAFLNEPPVLDRPTSSYKPQFHVANLAASKLNKHSGISV